jgi:ribosomal protein L37AE/L43A
MTKKKSKLSTPDWILKGYDGEADYNKAKGISEKKTGKTFKIRECLKCGSDDVSVVIGEIGMWECKKCGWKGVDVKEKELGEEEFMKYLDEKGEEVA